MDGLRLPGQGMGAVPPYMYPSPGMDPRLLGPANLSMKPADARQISPPAGSRQTSPPGGSSAAVASPIGIKRSLSTEYPAPAGHDVLDLSIKKPKIASPGSGRPSDTVPASSPSTSAIPSTAGSAGTAGSAAVPSAAGSINGSFPTLGLTAPAASGFTAPAVPYPPGYPAGYLDPRVLGMPKLTPVPSSPGAGGLSSLTQAQQQSVLMAPPVAGYPISHLPPHLSYAHLYAAAAEREKLLQKSHMSPLNADLVRMQSAALL